MAVMSMPGQMHRSRAEVPAELRNRSPVANGSAPRGRPRRRYAPTRSAPVDAVGRTDQVREPVADSKRVDLAAGHRTQRRGRQQKPDEALRVLEISAASTGWP